MSNRITVTEEDKTHEEWYKTADDVVKTPEELAVFVKGLMEDYNHDYGTMVHAMCAAMQATFKVMNEGSQGGITGFQAGFIAHWAVKKFMSIEPPYRITDFNNMLFPQYGYEFQTIPKEAWDVIQKKAAANIAHNDAVKDDDIKASKKVVEHWESILDGKVPFGFGIRED